MIPDNRKFYSIGTMDTLTLPFGIEHTCTCKVHFFQHLLASVWNISDIGDYIVKMAVIFSDTCHQEIYSVGDTVLPLCGDLLISCFTLRQQQGGLLHNKFDQCYQMVRGQTKDILWGIVL